MAAQRRASTPTALFVFELAALQTHRVRNGGAQLLIGVSRCLAQRQTKTLGGAPANAWGNNPRP
eukprot:3977856-Lingulodinium_polyedra.AAC.1